MIITKVYRDSTYEMRIKAPITLSIQVFITVLFILLSTVQFINRNIYQGFIIVILIFTNLFTISLLYKKKYDVSVRVFCFILAVLITINQFFQGYTGDLTYPQFTIMHIVVLTLVAYMIRQKKIYNYYLLASIISYSSFILLTIVTGAWREGTKPLLAQLDIALSGYIISMFILFQLKRTFILVTKDAHEQFKNSEKQRDKMMELIKSVSKQLAETTKLETSALDTKSASSHIENRISTIKDLIKQSSVSSISTVESLADITRSMQHLSEKAEDQSANVTQSSAAIEEMVASIKNVSSIIQQRQRSVNSLMKTSEDGEITISNTTSSFNNLLEQLDTTRSITGLISSIASQTNLLAMNAAIEAAHAGDAGKGFAVVADEIRKLAENASTNATKISESLKELITSIEKTGKEVKRSGESFSDIKNEVKVVANAMDEIASSTRELTSGSDEILKATANLNNLTVDVQEGVTKVNQDHDIIESNIEQSREISQKLEFEAQQIDKETHEIVSRSEQILNMSSQLREQTAKLNQSIS